MPQRDYLLRLIEQAMDVLLRITRLRTGGQSKQAVMEVIDAMEKLFGLKVSDLGTFNEDQLYDQLTRQENSRQARDKCLVFAALNQQAGLAYHERELTALAQPAFHLALVFTLRALSSFSDQDLPSLTPKVDELLASLDGFSLPEGTQDLLRRWQLTHFKSPA